VRSPTASTRWLNPVFGRLGWLLARVVSNVAYLVDPHLPPIGLIFIPPTWLRFLLGILGLILTAIFFVASLDEPPTASVGRRARTQERAAKPSVLVTGLTNLAVLLAGRRRAHIREAWLSDLERPCDPTDEVVAGVSATRKVTYAADLVRAAVCYRIDDVTVLWWRAVDGLLASRSWSRLVLVGPCGVALAMIVHREGLYGLVTNAGNFVAIGTASAGLIYGGRKARKVTVKPTRQKQDQQRCGDPM